MNGMEMLDVKDTKKIKKKKKFELKKKTKKHYLKNKVIHIFNPSTLKAEIGRALWV